MKRSDKVKAVSCLQEMILNSIWDNIKLQALKGNLFWVELEASHGQIWIIFQYKLKQSIMIIKWETPIFCWTVLNQGAYLPIGTVIIRVVHQTSKSTKEKRKGEKFQAILKDWNIRHWIETVTN